MKRAIALPIVSLFALGTLSMAPAVADEAPSDPCAKEQSQVDRATAKWEDLQVKYQEHKTKKNQKAKKAQGQRVKAAQARLDDCRADAADAADAATA